MAQVIVIGDWTLVLPSINLKQQAVEFSSYSNGLSCFDFSEIATLKDEDLRIIAKKATHETRVHLEKWNNFAHTQNVLYKVPEVYSKPIMCVHCGQRVKGLIRFAKHMHFSHKGDSRIDKELYERLETINNKLLQNKETLIQQESIQERNKIYANL